MDLDIDQLMAMADEDLSHHCVGADLTSSPSQPEHELELESGLVPDTEHDSGDSGDSGDSRPTRPTRRTRRAPPVPDTELVQQLGTEAAKVHLLTQALCSARVLSPDDKRGVWSGLLALLEHAPELSDTVQLWRHHHHTGACCSIDPAATPGWFFGTAKRVLGDGIFRTVQNRVRKAQQALNAEALHPALPVGVTPPTTTTPRTTTTSLTTTPLTMTETAPPPDLIDIVAVVEHDLNTTTKRADKLRELNATAISLEFGILGWGMGVANDNAGLINRLFAQTAELSFSPAGDHLINHALDDLVHIDWRTGILSGSRTDRDGVFAGFVANATADGLWYDQTGAGHRARQGALPLEVLHLLLGHKNMAWVPTDNPHEMLELIQLVGKDNVHHVAAGAVILDIERVPAGRFCIPLTRPTTPFPPKHVSSMHARQQSAHDAYHSARAWLERLAYAQGYTNVGSSGCLSRSHPRVPGAQVVVIDPVTQAPLQITDWVRHNVSQLPIATRRNKYKELLEHFADYPGCPLLPRLRHKDRTKILFQDGYLPLDKVSVAAMATMRAKPELLRLLRRELPDMQGRAPMFVRDCRLQDLVHDGTPNFDELMDLQFGDELMEQQPDQHTDKHNTAAFSSPDMLRALMGRLHFATGVMDGWELAFILRGVAGSGKTTILENVVDQWFPVEEIVPADFSGTGNRFRWNALLHGTGFVQGRDMPDYVLDVWGPDFLNACSGSVQNVEVKNEKRVHQVRWTTPIIGTLNGPLTKNDPKGAKRRRAAIIYFGNKTRGDDTKRTNTQQESPVIELDCLLAYARLLAYCREHKFGPGSDEFPLPPNMQQTRDNVTASGNPAMGWLLSQDCVPDPNFYIEVTALSKLYREERRARPPEWREVIALPAVREAMPGVEHISGKKCRFCNRLHLKDCCAEFVAGEGGRYGKLAVLKGLRNLDFPGCHRLTGNAAGSAARVGGAASSSFLGRSVPTPAVF